MVVRKRLQVAPKILLRATVDGIDRKGVYVTVFGRDGSQGCQYISHRCNPNNIREDNWAIVFRGKLYPFKKPGLSSQQWDEIKRKVDELCKELETSDTVSQEESNTDMRLNGCESA